MPEPFDYSIIDACEDPKLFGPWFKDYSSWTAWFVFLKYLFDLPMDRNDEVICRKHTNREKLVRRRFTEAWLAVGRRGGKSLILSLIATYLACFVDWRRYLSPGEVGTIMIIAQDRRQASVIFKYILAFLTHIPLLKKRLAGRETNTLIELTGGICIEIHTASFRSVRGYTIVAALLDEIAFWKTEDSANPDDEIVNALKPGMLTIPNSMLLCASSKYAKKGILYRTWKRHFGDEDSKILVWEAESIDMNPLLPKEEIEEAYRNDPVKAGSEYGTRWRDDIEEFLPQEIVDEVVVRGRHELPPLKNVTYIGFVDPSGGSKDSFSLGIAHVDDQSEVLDLVREKRPPFSPEAVTEEYSKILKDYGITKVIGDRYGGEWPRERFRKHGINYEVSDLTKSDIYLEVLPKFNSATVELLDIQRLCVQLVGLERRVSKRGKDTVDHLVGAHDDLANAAAGALYYCRPRSVNWNISDCHVGPPLASSRIKFDEIGEL